MAFILGICGGLSIITRATFVPFFVIACAWLALSMRRRAAGWKTVILIQNTILIGALLILIPISIQGYRVTGLFSPLPETGPINLYIGNNSERDAIMAIRPGGEWEDIMLMPARVGLRTRSEAHDYYLGRVSRYIEQEPVHFVKRLCRKTVHLFSSREIPNNIDIYANRALSPLYAALVWKTHGFGFPFGILLPFLCIGLVCRWRAIPGVVKLFLLLYSLSIILVFVTARYRAPMIPAMILIAAAGFWCVIDAVRARRWRTVALQCSAFAAVVVLSSVGGPFAAELVNFKAEKYRAMALYHLDRGEMGATMDNLHTALDHDPGFSEAYLSLGMAYVRQKQFEEASRLFQRAIELKPNYYSAHNNMGALRGRQGKNDEAYYHFKKALELNPYSDTIHWNIGIALDQLGRHKEAGEYIRKALYYAELFGNDTLAARIRNNFGNYLQRERD